jgi:precorrin isomerase
MILATGIGDSPLFLAVIGGMFGVFSGGSLVALVRVKADKHRIVVDAAQGAVIVQSGVIESLNAELARVRTELAEVSAANRRNERRVTRLEQEIRQAGLEIPNGNH